MSIMFADDFMGYGGNAALLLNGLWGIASCDISPSPDPLDPVGTKTMHFQGFGNQARRPFPVGNVAVAGAAFRLWLPALPDFGTGCARFLGIDGGLQTNFCILPNGSVEVWRGSAGHGGAKLGDTGGIPVLTANAFHHIEFKVVTSGEAPTGSVELRIDGVPVLTLNAVITGVAAQLGLGTGNDYNGTASRVDFIKDLVCWNGLGAHNTDFLGTVSVIALTPDADVALGWTPSTGATGYDLINQSPPNDADDYLSAAYPAPPPSTFSLTDLPLNVTSVRAMISQVRARKADGGDGNIQMSMISSGDHVDGSDRPTTTAFTYYEDVFQTDPHTNNSWTPAAADNAELKFNRTV